MTARDLALGGLLVLMASCSRADAVPRKDDVAEPPAAASELAPSSAPDYLVVDVEGMTCGGCKWEIEDKFTKIDGVVAVNVNLAAECVVIGYDANKIQKKRLLKGFDELSYKVREIGGERLTSTHTGEVRCIARR